MKRFFWLIIFILLPTQAWASVITNPQVVSSMRVEIEERSTIFLMGSIGTVELNFSIPQEDEYQKIESLEVSDSNGVCHSEKCSYKFASDKYGNRILSILWKGPQEDIKFKVKSTVSIKTRRSLNENKNPAFILPTSLVQSTDQEIADLASKARGTDFEKVAYLSKWINQNIKYDKIFSDINMSAKEILQAKRGVCDEFSNLLVSFLRNLGYFSGVAVGYVHPGKVYEGEKFQPHGWVEVYNDKGILADPTWTEVGYLDATHIKFGVFPDSNWVFGNIVVKGEWSLRALLDRVTTEIKVLSFEEEPLISSKSGFLDNEVWREYAVIQTNLSADGCILTKMNVKSCVDEYGNEILTKVNKDDVVYFCGDKKYFSTLKIPDGLKSDMRYKCEVNVFPLAGEQNMVLLSILYEKTDGVRLFTEKSVLTPGETMTVDAPDSFIFSDSGDFGFNRMKITAPYYDFKIYSYKSGYLMESDILVVSAKPFEITLSSPENVTVGETIPVTVNVKNLRDGEQTVQIDFREETVRDNIIGTKNFYFNFTPKSVDDNLIQVFASTLYFSTSASKLVKVTEKEGILENITRGFNSFLEWLFEIFKSIFK